MSHLRRVAAAVKQADKDLTAAEAAKSGTPDFNKPLADLIIAAASLAAAAKAVVPKA
jgi:hypothetical protein